MTPRASSSSSSSFGLPTLAEVAAQPRNLQKSAQPSRLQVKDAKDKQDAALLKVWRDAVFDRDEGRCRHCDVKVIRLSVQRLHPRRAEANHIAGRDDKAVRYDVRNGVLLCLKCHERVTGIVNDKLTIVGTVWFTKGGTRYINGQYPVTFKEAQ